MSSRTIAWKYAGLLTFLIMITMNALANILPINGITTGEVSDSFPNLFAPAGITFSIWGIIYLLLGLYVLYSLRVLGHASRMKEETVVRTMKLFVFTNLVNSIWIIFWHHLEMEVTLLLMVLLLLSLAIIRRRIAKATLMRTERLFVQIPFSVYFGWITVATIANVTILLVSRGFTGFGIREDYWTVLIAAVGLLIGMLVTLKYMDLAYGLVFLWAYAGILLKHVSADGFAGAYPVVIVTQVVYLGIILLTLVAVWRGNGKKDYKRVYQ